MYCVAGAGIFVIVWLYYGLMYFTWLSSEKIIRYTIDVPHPPGDGRVMDNPSIKVRNRNI